MPQAVTTSNSRIPAATAVPDVRFARGQRVAAIASGDGDVIPSWDEATRSFEFVLASETPCRSYRFSPDGYDIVEVDEVLSMEGIRDVGLLVGAPLLDMHNTYSLRNVIGVIVEARVEGTELVCRGRLWGREDLQDVIDGVRTGILRNMSVGFDRETETYEERAGQAPLVTVTSWQPCEGSVVTVPADPTAQTRAGGAKPPAKGARRPATTKPNTRTSAMAKKPTEAQRAAVSEAEAALAIAESGLDEARKAAGMPARAKRDDEGEREGDEPETQEDGAEGADAEKDEKKRAAAAAAAKRSTLVEGLRVVAQRRGKDALADFEAIEAAGGSLDELRAAAVSAVRSGGLSTSTPTAARHQGTVVEKPVLRSFAESAVAKRNHR